MNDKKVTQILEKINKNNKDEELWNSLKNELYPMKKDSSHGVNHINSVDSLSVEMYNKLMKARNKEVNPIDILKLRLAATFHDCTSEKDRENHEISGAKVFKKLASNVFPSSIVNEVVKMIEHHRASYEGLFGSELEEIISSADRGEPATLDSRIERSFKYASERGKNSKEAWMHAIDHMKEKFGRNGYQKLPNIYLSFYKDKILKLWKEIDHLDYNYNPALQKKLGVI